jgi:hypothetical protein
MVLKPQELSETELFGIGMGYHLVHQVPAAHPLHFGEAHGGIDPKKRALVRQFAVYGERVPGHGGGVLALLKDRWRAFWNN